MTLKKGFGTPVRYLFYQPMDEKIKTWTLRFPTKENPNMEKALFDWPIVLQYDVKAKYRLISRKFSGVKFLSPQNSLSQPKATRVCNRSINQSNRSIPFICFFCFLRAFSFQGHTKIALVHPFTSSNHEIRNKFQRTSSVSCSLDRNYV